MGNYETPEATYYSAEALSSVYYSMSGGGGGTSIPTTGTESSPATLSGKSTKSIAGSGEYWFKCSVYGAMVYSFTATYDVQVVIYKKNLIGKTQLRSKTGKNWHEIVYSLDEITNGSNTYYIKIKGTRTSGSTTVTVEMGQQIDSFVSSTGGIWKPYERTAMPALNPAILYFQKWFVDNTRVSFLVDMVSKADFLDYQSKLVAGTMKAAEIVAAMWAGVPGIMVETLVTWLEHATDFLNILNDPLDFKQQVLDNINEVAGYTGIGENNFPTYTGGACLIECMTNGIMSYVIEAWNPNDMSGPGGWHGEWTENPPF